MTQENSETPGGASVEREEIARFAALAEDWWRPDGSFRALHALNIPRLTYIRDRLCRQHGRDIRDGSPLAGLSLLDIGCGGGSRWLASAPRSRRSTPAATPSRRRGCMPADPGSTSITGASAPRNWPPRIFSSIAC